MKNIVIAVITLMFTVNLDAQNRFEQNNEEMKSKKKAFISDKLNLSKKKTASFWPLYNKFNDEMESIKKDRRKIMFDIRKKSESASEEELATILSGLQIIDELEYKTKTRYNSELSKTLTAKETTLLLMSELNFKQQRSKRVIDPKAKELKENRQVNITD
jgi:hypothetical protein